MHIAVAFLHMHANAHHMHVYVYENVNLLNRLFVYPQPMMTRCMECLHISITVNTIKFLHGGPCFVPWLWCYFLHVFCLVKRKRVPGKSEWSLGKKCLSCLKVLNAFPLILVHFSVLASFFSVFVSALCCFLLSPVLLVFADYHVFFPVYRAKCSGFFMFDIFLLFVWNEQGFVCVCLAPGEFAQTCYTLQIAPQTWHRVLYLRYARR